MSSMHCQILDPISQLDGDVLTFSMHQWEILIKKIPTLQRYFLQNQFDLNKLKKNLHLAICHLYPLITYSIKRVMTDWKGYFLPSWEEYNCPLKAFKFN